MSSADEPFRWRSVIVAALLPTLLFSTGEGAIIPVIPVIAGNVGATLAIAGFVAGMLVLGELLGDIPSGVVIAHIGERTAMIAASGLSVLGLLTALLAPNPWVLGLGILVVGVATAVFALARHAFMTSFVPMRYRARALSTLGGSFRLGYLVGPFIGAGVISLTGAASSVFWIHIAGCVAAAVVLLVLADHEHARDEARDGEGGPDVARDHRDHRDDRPLAGGEQQRGQQRRHQHRSPAEGLIGGGAHGLLHVTPAGGCARPPVGWSAP